MSNMTMNEQKKKDKYTLAVDGVDLEMLESVRDKFNLKDNSAVLKFAIAIMNATEKNRIAISKDDKAVEVLPADILVKNPKKTTKTKKKPDAGKK